MVESRVPGAFIAMGVSLALFLAACSGGGPTASRQASDVRVHVVTTSSILGDWARQVGGEDVDVVDLIPPGADPHTFQPGARDIARVAEADLVLSVGLNLEGRWLTELINNLEVEDARTLALGPLVDPIKTGDGSDGILRTEAEMDPHFWMDPARAKVAVLAIADELALLDAVRGDVYRENAEVYTRALDQLDTWAAAKFSALPVEDRTLVTSHDSLAYFALRYEVRIVGAVIPGISTERDPSAREMADLVEAIRESSARAILVEDSVSDRMARRISEETGTPVVGGIAVGTLGPIDSETGTYEDMMRRNVEIITQALK